MALLSYARWLVFGRFFAVDYEFVGGKSICQLKLFELL